MGDFLEAAVAESAGKDIWWVDQNAALSEFLFSPTDSIQDLRIQGFLVVPTQFEDRVAAISRR